jgi:DNA-binding XRE family transcriptional regulator
MAVVDISTPLKEYRVSLSPKVSQERLARKAELVLQTYRNAESGRRCSYSTATAILKALNAERQARNLSLVSLEQLGLSIV